MNCGAKWPPALVGGGGHPFSDGAFVSSACVVVAMDFKAKHAPINNAHLQPDVVISP